MVRAGANSFHEKAGARESFDISSLPEDALDEINRIQTRQRLNEVVKTGIPGFIPRGR
jgi:alcohol dehydrogenase (NADP+)